MRVGTWTLLVGLGLVLFSTGASALSDTVLSGNVTYHLDDEQTGFTNYGPALNNGIDFNPNVSEFLVGGETAYAFLDFQVFGNDAGGGNVFAFDDFDFTLQGTVTSLPVGTVDISITGTVDVIGASQGGVDIGNPNLDSLSVFDTLLDTTGAWSNTQSWNIFDDFLDGTAFETAVATGLDFSLAIALMANDGASISQITDAMSDIGVSVQPGVAIPEPTTGLLLGLGLFGIGWTRRQRRHPA
jgi:hypothetical protein